MTAEAFRNKHKEPGKLLVGLVLEDDVLTATDADILTSYPGATFVPLDRCESGIEVAQIKAVDFVVSMYRSVSDFAASRGIPGVTMANPCRVLGWMPTAIKAGEEVMIAHFRTEVRHGA